MGSPLSEAPAGCGHPGIKSSSQANVGRPLAPRLFRNVGAQERMPEGAPPVGLGCPQGGAGGCRGAIAEARRVLAGCRCLGLAPLLVLSDVPENPNPASALGESSLSSRSLPSGHPDPWRGPLSHQRPAKVGLVPPDHTGSGPGEPAVKPPSPEVRGAVCGRPTWSDVAEDTAWPTDGHKTWAQRAAPARSVC